MPAPNIFISSTFYDLRYIRDNLRFFVRSLGYNPILSERGTVFFDPQRTAAEAAVSEVSNCQLFVLIIGGRYGSELGETDQSVTNAEYQEAVNQKVPVYALVEHGTLADYEVWRTNCDAEVPENQIRFPNADDPRIFAFIDEVRSQGSNNALVPFQDFGDIETYLRQQWAALLHSFLSGMKEENRVADTLSGLERIGQRVEILSTQILESVGTEEAKLLAEMYDRMMGSSAVQDLTALRLRPTPVDILRNESFFECTRQLGGDWEVESEDEKSGYSTTITGNQGSMSYLHAESIKEDYAELRSDLGKQLDASALDLPALENRVNRAVTPESV